MANNIHAATVTAGSTSAGAERDFSQLSLTELGQEKQRIEQELKENSAVLSSYAVSMTSTLTTFDGFPRSDIDVPQVRMARVRIIHLRNDHKEVMKYMEQGVHAHFAQLRNSTGNNTGATATTNGTSVSSSAPTANPDNINPRTRAFGAPFAKINAVEPGSPAYQAGLKVGDLILGFGSIHWLNPGLLSKIAETVQENEGRPILVKVSRKEESGSGTIELQLQLTPRRNWGGRGMLGCLLVPL
ncbi:hypothetical protein N7495_009235 [Penicillium taxi]|uniref:uncharacterized protein n=1 Tax=Penicillium taxi TaxID=168475 RepID=UPI00254536FB|nr:uncharacterized protein N7495_009235 [Penicillium taxi]KAJ5884725.1 hypothetical protein N7495_009235 [Penicillium taxi]